MLNTEPVFPFCRDNKRGKWMKFLGRKAEGRKGFNHEDTKAGKIAEGVSGFEWSE